MQLKENDFIFNLWRKIIYFGIENMTVETKRLATKGIFEIFRVALNGILDS